MKRGLGSNGRRAKGGVLDTLVPLDDEVEDVDAVDMANVVVDIATHVVLTCTVGLHPFMKRQSYRQLLMGEGRVERLRNLLEGCRL